MRSLGRVTWLLFVVLIAAKNLYDMQNLKGNTKQLKGHSEESEENKNEEVAFTEQSLNKRNPKNVISGTIFDGIDYSVKSKRAEQMPLKADKENVHEIVLLSLLTQIRSISIFSGYLRDLQQLSSVMEDPDKFTVVAAPSDNALLHKLNGLKPWEFPYKLRGDEDDDKTAQRNLQNFMLSHIIESLAFLRGGESELQGKTFNQKNITIKSTAEDGYVIMFCGKVIPVVSTKQVINGNILIIDDVLISSPEVIGGI